MMLFKLKQLIDRKKEENGHKSAIEMFLLEEEQKKEKLRKKRLQKKNRKKKTKKEDELNKKSSTSSTRDSQDRLNNFVSKITEQDVSFFLFLPSCKPLEEGCSSRERRLLVSLGWRERSHSSSELKQELDHLKQHHWQSIS